jgi:hypothetical protein
LNDSHAVTNGVAFSRRRKFVSLRLFPLTLTVCILAGAASLPAQTQSPNSAKTAPKMAPTAAGNAEKGDTLWEFKFFSATVNGGLADDHDRRIHRSGDLLRVDFDNGEYRITDLNKRSMWGIYGKQCAYFVRPDVSSFPFSGYQNFKPERAMTNEEETVDGHLTRIENVTLTRTEGPPLVVKMKLWRAQDLEGFPIKIFIDAGDGHPLTSTYSNVDMTPPDPKLFEHPTKCTPFDRPATKTTQPAPAPPKQDSGSQEKLLTR